MIGGNSRVSKGIMPLMESESVHYKNFAALVLFKTMGYSRKNPHSHDGRHAGKSHGRGG